MSEKRLGAVLLLAAILLGGALRFALLAASDFPYNDGGMVLVMTEEVLESRGRLPAFTTYNTGPAGARAAEAIPFAYPPLPFYLAALPAGLLGLPLLQIQHWLPGLFSLLTIPAFYWLALNLLNQAPRAGFAALVYALALPSFDRVLMGGGLTRAPGMLFAILALAAVQRVFAGRRSRGSLAGAAVLCSLAILSHPVTAWFTAYSAALLLAFAPQRRRNLPAAAWIAGGALLLTAPWWLGLLQTHGLSPLLAALSTRSGLSLPAAVGSLLLFDLTREAFLDIIGALALFGLLADLAARRWLLPAWLALIFLLERTTPLTFAILPLAMLAAGGAALAAAAVLNQPGIRQPFARRIIAAALVILPLYALLSSYVTFQPPVLSAASREAMAWAERSTPAASRFLVLTGLNWWDDPVSEWFPVLAQRRSLATVQGSEWLPGAGFAWRSAANAALQACLASGDPACLSAWNQFSPEQPDYLYISDPDSRLAAALRLSPAYRVVYENQAAAVFQVR